MTEVLRNGSRRLLREAIEAEVESFLAEYRDEVTEDGRRWLVRNGYMPEREIQTGIGGVPVNAPRVRDRSGSLQFRSKVALPYLRRAKSVEELLPWLYLRGISTGDFSDALEALVGPDAPGLSAGTISRLRRIWGKEYTDWRTRYLSSKRYVYVWADGIHCKARLDDAKLCLLVLMGATEDGTKDLIVVEDGYRESETSWLELLRSLEGRGGLSLSRGVVPLQRSVGQCVPQRTGRPSWQPVTALWASGRPKTGSPPDPTIHNI